MLKIIITSKNPVKINATSDAFQKMFPDETFKIDSISVVSGIGDQPKTEQETFQAALNRAENGRKAIPDADFWVGIEGGVEEKNSEIESFTWVVVQSKNGKLGKGRTGTLFLPSRLAELIKQGEELGEAADIVFGQTNSKQKNGVVGLLTNNAIDRTRYYAEAIILALIPFKNRNLY